MHCDPQIFALVRACPVLECNSATVQGPGKQSLKVEKIFFGGILATFFFIVCEAWTSNPCTFTAENFGFSNKE
jgi:hypothetical protein